MNRTLDFPTPAGVAGCVSSIDGFIARVDAIRDMILTSWARYLEIGDLGLATADYLIASEALHGVFAVVDRYTSLEADVSRRILEPWDLADSVGSVPPLPSAGSGVRRGGVGDSITMLDHAMESFLESVASDCEEEVAEFVRSGWCEGENEDGEHWLVALPIDGLNEFERALHVWQGHPVWACRTTLFSVPSGVAVHLRDDRGAVVLGPCGDDEDGEWVADLVAGQVRLGDNLSEGYVTAMAEVFG